MILLRKNLVTNDDFCIRTYLPEATLTASDKKEFAANAHYEATLIEKPEEKVIFDDILFKVDFIKTFQDVKSKLEITGNQTILELGASHGWAGVLLKKDFRLVRWSRAT